MGTEALVLKIGTLIVTGLMSFFMGKLGEKKKVKEAEQALDTVVESVEERGQVGFKEEVKEVKKSVARNVERLAISGVTHLINKAVDKASRKFGTNRK